MNDVLTISTVIKTILIAIAASAPSIVGLVLAIKKYFIAKTVAEKEAAKSELASYMQQAVEDVEVMYGDVNMVLKQKGGSAGNVKKETVLSKMQQYAIEKGFEFNRDFWSEQIDALVSLTKSVNK